MLGRNRFRLVADTLRGHRLGMILWVLVGAASQYAVAASLTREFQTFPGGARALAPTVEAAAEAMRVLRWPAERLDTLGGYLTYHNLTLLPLLLGLYAAIQGVQAVRGAEAGGSLEEILATGWPRLSFLRDRALGFVAVLAVICLGVGLGTAAGLAAGGEPNTAGSLLIVAEGGLCAFTFYALAVLSAQLFRAPRSATGVVVLVMSALYVFTNVWQLSGPLAPLRFLSPFFYYQQSFVLVPGHRFDPLATLALAGLAAAPLAGAAWAFARRDYRAPLWARRAGASRRGATAVLRPWLDWLWSASLYRQRLGLLGWAAGTAAMAAMIASMEPQVRGLWDKIEFMRQLAAVSGAGSLTDQFFAFAGTLLAPIAAAYATTQVASWIADLQQGRVELVLASPVSWTRLVVERLLALSGGVMVIVLAAVLGLVAGAAAAGVPLRADGLLRMAADGLLFGLAAGGAGAALAAWLRNGLAPALLGVLVAVSYLLDLLAPAFDWPDWVHRLSMFNAFGQPYVEVPGLGGLALLAGLALLGALAAAVLSERSPKVA